MQHWVTRVEARPEIAEEELCNAIIRVDCSKLSGL